MMYHDVVNPPAAARFYAYSLLTGYEILSQLNTGVQRFQQSINQYPAIQVIIPSAVNKELASLYGILETGKNIIPSGYLLEAKQKKLLETYTLNKLSKQVIDSSVSFAKQISKLLVQYARSDGYFKLSTHRRYTPLNTVDAWKLPWIKFSIPVFK